METRANFIAVGLFVIALFLSLLAFIVWLSNWQAERNYRDYWIYFSGSVKGLRVGSSVTYRGITVGEVTSIGFPEDGNVERIVVKTRIDEDAPIRTDTIASLEIQGLAGGALINLRGGSNAAPRIEPEEGKKYAVITSGPSQLDRLLAGAPALVEQVQELVARASLALSDDNQAAISDILRNVATLSSALAGRADSIDAIVGDAQGTLEEIRKAAASAQSVAGVLERDVPAAMSAATAALKNVERASDDVEGFVAQARTTANAFEAVAKETQAMIRENRPAIRDFTGTTLYDTNAFLADVRVLVDNLNRLTTEVGRDPARFLFGGQQRGYEAR